MNRRGNAASPPGAALCLLGPGAGGESPTAERPRMTWTRPMVPPLRRGAVVLFDGKELSKWVNRKDGQPAGWTVEHGYMEVRPATGDILTPGHLHGLPAPPGVLAAADGRRPRDRRAPTAASTTRAGSRSRCWTPTGSRRGTTRRAASTRWPSRSGTPPRSRNSGRRYDIAYRAPRIGADGKQTEKGRITVFHNGVLIHNNVAFDAQTTTSGLPPGGQRLLEARPDPAAGSRQQGPLPEHLDPQGR